MRIHPHRPMERAVTLTELLLVLLIVSLLATLAIPTVTRRARDARISTARAEAKALAEAEMACAAFHGYFVPLQLLDNLPEDDTNPTGSDQMGNEDGATIRVVSVNADISNQFGSIIQLDEVPELSENWQGPFIQPQRVVVDPEVDFDDSTNLREDFPLDPWGRPYILYSPLGPVGTGEASAASSSTPISVEDDILNASNWGDGILTSGGVTDRFDRWAVVSFGPDGVSGTAFPSPGDRTVIGDDIVHYFGGDAATTNSV